MTLDSINASDTSLARAHALFLQQSLVLISKYDSQVTQIQFLQNYIQSSFGLLIETDSISEQELKKYGQKLSEVFQITTTRLVYMQSAVDPSKYLFGLVPVHPIEEGNPYVKDLRIEPFHFSKEYAAFYNTFLDTFTNTCLLRPHVYAETQPLRKIKAEVFAGGTNCMKGLVKYFGSLVTMQYLLGHRSGLTQFVDCFKSYAKDNKVNTVALVDMSVRWGPRGRTIRLVGFVPVRL